MHHYVRLAIDIQSLQYQGVHILPRPVSAPTSSQIILHLVLRICMTVDEQVSLCIDDSFFITS